MTSFLSWSILFPYFQLKINTQEDPSKLTIERKEAQHVMEQDRHPKSTALIVFSLVSHHTFIVPYCIMLVSMIVGNKGSFSIQVFDNFLFYFKLHSIAQNIKN